MACREAGLGCPGSFTTESREELVKHVQLHAHESHPELDLSREDIDQLIKVATPA
jgi:predicted small metal-binding protein